MSVCCGTVDLPIGQETKDESRVKKFFKKYFMQGNTFFSGPWWWSSGQRAHLQSDNPSLNPADVCSFSVKFVFEKNESKRKKIPGLSHFYTFIALLHSKENLFCHWDRTRGSS